MKKIILFLLIFFCFIAYTFLVYTNGTESNIKPNQFERELIKNGKTLFQQKNCIACHQIYGLGGFLGQDLTTAYSDPSRGEAFIRAFLQNGGNRMPNFKFEKTEMDALVAYLKYVDTTAITYK